MKRLSPSEIESLVRKRLVVISGTVDDNMFSNTSDIVCELLLQGAPDITVLICSSGGDVREGLNTYDLIANYPGKTKGIVFRIAASMAAVILQGCDERIAAQHAEVLIHHISRNSVSFDVFADDSGAKLAEIRENLTIRQTFLYTILGRKTKKKTEEIKVECAKDRPMTIEQALNFGLVDKVLSREEMMTIFRPSALPPKSQVT